MLSLLFLPIKIVKTDNSNVICNTDKCMTRVKIIDMDCKYTTFYRNNAPQTIKKTAKTNIFVDFDSLCVGNGITKCQYPLFI